MSDPIDGRGVLYPARLPTFHRVPAPEELSDRVRWFWIPRWNLAPGRTSRQQVLPFPASNLVVEADGVSLAGPATGASHRDLRGRGWAVGALLRPAAVPSLLSESNPPRLRDMTMPFAAPDLHRAIVGAMSREGETDAREHAVAVYVEWAHENLAPPDEGGVLANTIEDLISTDREITRVDQVADRLDLTIRHVQRLAQRYVGLPPLTMIRRYRLQEAAQRLRDEPDLTITRVAADLGYADQAHLAHDFRHVLGLAPNAYRHDSSE